MRDAASAPADVERPVLGDRSSALAFAHAPASATGPGRDTRSVGELLLEADRLAREALFDLTPDGAPMLLRSWIRVATAATGVWSQIEVAARPASRTVDEHQGVGRTVDGDAMNQLRCVAEGMRRPLASSRWPGPGPGSPVADTVADTYDRAARLIARFGGDLPVHRPATCDDLAAARTLVAHSLYLLTHATVAAMESYGARLVHDPPPGTARPMLATPGRPYAVGPTGRWVQQVAMCEAIAGRVVARSGGWVGGLAGAVIGEAPDIPDPGRVAGALTAWDVDAHRALVASPSAQTVLVVCRVQALLCAATLKSIDLAGWVEPGEQGDKAPAVPTVDRAQVEGLRTAVNISGLAWQAVANRWADLATGAPPANPTVVHGAAEVRAALRSTIGNLPSARGDIPGRTQSPLDLADLTVVLEAAVDAARLVLEAGRDSSLTGPARALSIRAHNEVETATDAGRGRPDESEVVWVTPHDVLANTRVPLPRPVSDGLIAACSEALHRSTRAASAAVALASETQRETGGPPGPVLARDSERGPVQPRQPRHPRETVDPRSPRQVRTPATLKLSDRPRAR